MTTTTEITLDQVLDLAYKLSVRDQARLIARLAPAIERALDAPSATVDDPWERLERLRAEFEQLGPVSPSPAEQLDADRLARDAVLMGKDSVGDVHS